MGGCVSLPNANIKEPKSVTEFKQKVANVANVLGSTQPAEDLFQRQASPTASVEIACTGEKNTTSFRLKFRDTSKGIDVSPWHDIPLHASEQGVVRMLVEIPKMTTSKFEVATKERGNPIAQDVKKGKLREYHGPIFWNYGMLPQTWEDPNHLHPELNVMGDNDPLDVVEIGSKPLEFGTIAKVKVLGVLAMIDDGELDWKIIAVNVEDALAEQLHDIEDVEKHCPGVVSGIREWLRWYKTPDGKPLNQFGFSEKALNKAKAMEVVSETHAAWKGLCNTANSENDLWTAACIAPADVPDTKTTERTAIESKGDLSV